MLCNFIFYTLQIHHVDPHCIIMLRDGPLQYHCVRVYSRKSGLLHEDIIIQRRKILGTLGIGENVIGIVTEPLDLNGCRKHFNYRVPNYSPPCIFNTTYACANYGIHLYELTSDGGHVLLREFIGPWNRPPMIGRYLTRFHIYGVTVTDVNSKFTHYTFDATEICKT